MAGGGTGGTTLYMSERLNCTNAEIVYIDFSKSSLSLSKRRAKYQNIYNIIWINDWLEDVKCLGLCHFHFIESSGVLHHLKSPIHGLNTIKDMLCYNGGGMELMLYAKFGRTAIYQMQSLFRMMFNNDDHTSSKVRKTRMTIKKLPATNWFIRYVNSNLEIIKDHIYFGDSGYYDMFLNSRDVKFTIKELQNFVAKSGTNFVKHSSIYQYLDIINTYDRIPEILNNRLILEDKKMSIHELISGNVIKHEITISAILNNTEQLQLDKP